MKTKCEKNQHFYISRYDTETLNIYKEKGVWPIKVTLKSTYLCDICCRCGKKIIR